MSAYDPPDIVEHLHGHRAQGHWNVEVRAEGDQLVSCTVCDPERRARAYMRADLLREVRTLREAADALAEADAWNGGQGGGVRINAVTWLRERADEIAART